MVMFALATGMTIVLLKCAEGGYVKLVEFVARKCLGYYGMNSNTSTSRSEDGVEEETKKMGWNEYMLRFLPRRVAEKKEVVDKFVLDKKTMLFQRPPPTAALVAAARGKGKSHEMHFAAHITLLVSLAFAHTLITSSTIRLSP